MSDDTTIFDRLGVLSDPTRGRILLLLERQELAVSELCTVLQQPQSTVSRHLKVLSDGGWLASWRDGTSRIYRLRAELDGEAAELWGVLRGAIADRPEARQDRGRLDTVLRQRRARSREFFAEAGDDWDLLRGELFGARAELLPLLGFLDPGWTVGDLGCGTGVTTEALAPFVGRVVAVDESEAMLDAARRRLGDAGNVELRHGTLEELPVGDGELDAAVLMLVLHHLPHPAAVLAEAARALAPGGRLLVVDMLAHDRTRFRREMGHQWLGFERAGVEGWCAEAGLAGTRFVPLPPEPEAQGPNLFAASAVRPGVEAAAEEPADPPTARAVAAGTAG